MSIFHVKLSHMLHCTIVYDAYEMMVKLKTILQSMYAITVKMANSKLMKTNQVTESIATIQSK